MLLLITSARPMGCLPWLLEILVGTFRSIPAKPSAKKLLYKSVTSCSWPGAIVPQSEPLNAEKQAELVPGLFVAATKHKQPLAGAGPFHLSHQH